MNMKRKLFCFFSGGDGGSVDTSKLKGRWIKEGDTNRSLKFGDVQKSGKWAIIKVEYDTGKGDGSGYYGYPFIEGNIIKNAGNAFKTAVDGEKLTVSESKGDFTGTDGTYTKQP